MAGKKGRLRPYARLTEAQKELFLEVLAQTGNRGAAAAAIGVEPRCMDQRREYDADLDWRWDEALDAADRGLAGLEGPCDVAAGEEPMVVKRGKNGRLQRQKAGPKRWSRAVEDRFFATLAVCGNIAASARAVGFSESCIAQRRRRYPDFMRRMEEALEDAEVEIEFRMAAEVRGMRRGGRDSHFHAPPGEDGSRRGKETMGTVTSNCPQFDMDAAMRFLKWRQEKKRGGGRRGRAPAPPSIEQVTEKIVRQVEAIKRHRARREAGRG